MRALLRDEHRERLGEVEIDLTDRPTRVHIDETDRDVFLNWEGAVDDAGQLRKCLACGCGEMYAEKAFPQVTGFVVVLAFTGAALGLLGNDVPPPVLVAMTIVLIADVAILVFSRVRLVCYQCRSIDRDLTIARYHRSWDRSVADRYPLPTKPAAEATTSSTGSGSQPAAESSPSQRPARLDSRSQVTP